MAFYWAQSATCTWLVTIGLLVGLLEISCKPISQAPMDLPVLQMCGIPSEDFFSTTASADDSPFGKICTATGPGKNGNIYKPYCSLFKEVLLEACSQSESGKTSLQSEFVNFVNSTSISNAIEDQIGGMCSDFATLGTLPALSDLKSHEGLMYLGDKRICTLFCDPAGRSDNSNRKSMCLTIDFILQRRITLKDPVTENVKQDNDPGNVELADITAGLKTDTIPVEITSKDKTPSEDVNTEVLPEKTPQGETPSFNTERVKTDTGNIGVANPDIPETQNAENFNAEQVKSDTGNIGVANPDIPETQNAENFNAEQVKSDTGNIGVVNPDIPETQNAESLGQPSEGRQVQGEGVNTEVLPEKTSIDETPSFNTEQVKTDTGNIGVANPDIPETQNAENFEQPSEDLNAEVSDSEDTGSSDMSSSDLQWLGLDDRKEDGGGTDTDGGDDSDGADNGADYPADEKNVYKEKVGDYEDTNASSHFLAYSLTAIIVIMATYIMYHNKQRIIAIIIEGRNSNGRRRQKNDGYQKLDQNLSEAMPSLQTEASKDYTY